MNLISKWFSMGLVLVAGVAGCGPTDHQDAGCGFPVACPQIAFVEHPKDVTVVEGGTALFQVVVSSVSANPVRVTWSACNAGVPIDACDWDAPTGSQATSAFSLTVGPVNASMNGRRYRATALADDGQVLRSLAATLTVLAATAPGPLGPVGFNDGDFAAGDWTLTTYLGGNGGTVQVAPVASGGHPGSYRSILHQVNAAADPASTSRLFSLHFKSGATYDPAASGAIVAIDYAQESRLISTGGSQQATSLALRQAGQTFYATRAYQTISEADWAAKGMTGLLATDFVALMPDTSETALYPDFSATGQPIQFGFLRANSTSLGGGGYAVETGIDNWSVVVRRAP
ncbi:MAG TPA: hypothetical protein PLA97_11245 [Rubrivivax sp.]|nr:hypothetical protein [Rubrivivax sp.]